MSTYRNIVFGTSSSSGSSATQVIPGQEYKMTNNNGGGVSYSLKALAVNAKAKGDMALYRTCQLTLLRRVMIMGTDKNQYAVSAQKLTNEAVQLLNELVSVGEWSIILQEFKEVYGKSLAPKLSFSFLALAYLTTIPDSVSGSTAKTTAIRTQAYACVSTFRTLSHLLQWEMFHLAYSKERKVKSTGEGFRRAVGNWLLAHPGDWLSYQITKYQSREGVSAQDLLRLVHVKTTSATKCRCKKRTARDACSCDASKPIRDLVSPAHQVVLSYIAHDLKYASQTLSECMQRSTSSAESVSVEMSDAIKVFAFLCAVDTSKASTVSADELCDMISGFNLAREVVTTNHLNSCDVWLRLLCKMNTSGYGHLVHKLVKANSNDPTILNVLSTVISDKGESLHIPKNLEVNMPITALIRNLAKLSSLKIFSEDTHPCGRQLEMAVCKRLINPDVLAKGNVHPVSLMSAHATYSLGHGIKGSLTWQPNAQITKAIEEAFYASFRTLKGHGYKIAHGVDASGSMTSTSTPVAGMMACEVVACMVMAFYRVEYAYSEKNRTQFRQDIGYFQSGGRSYYNRNNNGYKDITSEVSNGTTFQEMRKLVSRSDFGSTDIGCFIQWTIDRLKSSLDGFKAKQNGLHKLPVFSWPGFYNALFVWTDNDVNSGTQPMPLVLKYQLLVRECFNVQRFTEDGKAVDGQDLENMIKANVPKFVVIATVPTSFTVGDPEDPNVLNVSGFDLSVPVLIDNFLSGGKTDGVEVEVEDTE